MRTNQPARMQGTPMPAELAVLNAGFACSAFSSNQLLRARDLQLPCGLNGVPTLLAIQQWTNSNGDCCQLRSHLAVSRMTC